MRLKQFFGLLCALSVLCSCISFSLAEEAVPDAVSDTPEPTVPSVVSAAPSPLSLVLPQPLEVSVTLVEPESDPPEVESPPLSVVSEVDLPQDSNTWLTQSTNATRDLQSGDLRPEGSVVSALTAILGEYSPATYQTVTYMDGATVVTVEVVPGLAGLDWPWITSAGILALMLYCLFRLLGGLWK